MGVNEKLLEIQRELKVEKKRYNSFGDFMSRSKEDILEAVKPLAHERGCVVKCDDEVRLLENGWVYVITTAMLEDVESGESASARAWAREPESKPKMDSSQTTGSASSYSGKRALGNLFAIDDTADSDQSPQREQAPGNGPFVAECTACGTRYQFNSADQLEKSMCQCGNTTFKVVG